MSENLSVQITEKTGLPAIAYYCNNLIELRLDYDRRQIVADMGNFLKRKRPYWVDVDEERIRVDSAFQTVEERKAKRWIREMDRPLNEESR